MGTSNTPRFTQQRKILTLNIRWQSKYVQNPDTKSRIILPGNIWNPVIGIKCGTLIGKENQRNQLCDHTLSFCHKNIMRANSRSVQPNFTTAKTQSQCQYHSIITK